MKDGGDELLNGAAWSQFCDHLKATGARILQDDFPVSPRDRAEGFRHLGRLTAYALQAFLDFDDPEFPAFLRYDDDTLKWGGPNSDNHYLRARIDPSATYRVRLDATGLRDLIVSTPEGDMQLQRYRVFEERSLEQLALGNDGWLEIVLGPGPAPTPEPRNWIPLHPEADHVLLRVYVSDWAGDAAPAAEIEKLDNRGTAPGPLEPERVARELGQAADWVGRTVVYWNDFLSTRRSQLPPNLPTPARPVPGGADDILYGAAWWQLGDDEALLLECEAPDARYWSFQLYSATWFESLDIANRINSLNGEQIQVDDDGHFRIAISARDPGLPNWLDTESRREGLVSYRWVGSSNAPRPTGRVVPVADARSLVPASTPVVDPASRREQVALRRAAVARRFRR